jgi:hypothetical protein
MKKKLLLFLIAAASCALLFSCNSNGLTGDTYTIKMRMNKGDTFHQHIKMDMNMKMDAMGQAVNMKTNMDMGVTFEVTDTSSTGKELKLTYTDMHMAMDMGSLQAGNMDSLMNTNLGKIIGKSLLLELSPSNEITEVKGFDSIMISSSSEADRKMTEKMFSKEQMTNMFGIMFGMYPGKPVKIGETWTSKSTVNIANIDMQINITYKLAGVKNGLADIDVAGIIDGKGDMKQNGMSIGMSMSGQQHGMLTIAMDNGYMQSGSYKMDVKAEMQMGGQKVPMTLTAAYYLTNK